MIQNVNAWLIHKFLIALFCLRYPAHFKYCENEFRRIVA